jgi:hypothetical protein
VNAAAVATLLIPKAEDNSKKRGLRRYPGVVPEVGG